MMRLRIKTGHNAQKDGDLPLCFELTIETGLGGVVLFEWDPNEREVGERNPPARLNRCLFRNEIHKKPPLMGGKNFCDFLAIA